MSFASPYVSISNTVNLPTVQLHALSAGRFTLPEEQFITPSTPGSRKTVPSLSFLIQHTNPFTGEITRIVFDLGLRSNVEGYSKPIQQHVATRQSVTTTPDVVASLADGGLRPDDIDFIIYSQVSSLMVTLRDPKYNMMVSLRLGSRVRNSPGRLHVIEFAMLRQREMAGSLRPYRYAAGLPQQHLHRRTWGIGRPRRETRSVEREPLIFRV
jgi:hypothetical protein